MIRGGAVWLWCLTAFASGCGRESVESRPSDSQALPAQGVPSCGLPAEFSRPDLTVTATLVDPTACESGTATLRAEWSDGRTQTIDLRGFGFPSDFWPVDLGEDGVTDLVVGHQDLAGGPPRIRAFREQSGGLREVFIPELTAELLPGYVGGGNFHVRAGALFFNWTASAETPGVRPEARALRLNPATDRWEEIDVRRFETDAPRPSEGRGRPE